MSQHRVLIYILRRDLRLADNPVFHEVAKLSQQLQRPFTHVLPVYVFPAQQVEVAGFLSSPDDQSPYPEARSQVGGFWRCGPHRARFLAESVWDLKTDLEKVGSGLAIRIGMVGQVVRDLLEGFRQDNVEVTSVWMTSEEGVEEQREERDVRGAAKSDGTDFKLWVDEKYFIDDRDLPFQKQSELPDVFTTFRKQVEPLRDGPRRSLPTPSNLAPLPPSIPRQSPPFSPPTSLESTIDSLLAPLNRSPLLENPPPYPHPTKSAHDFHGGARAGHDRVIHLMKSGAASAYKDTRNGLLGPDFSTKLSAWLALGCITARQIHSELVTFEDGKNDAEYKGSDGYGSGENKGTASIRFELLWRDYMRLCTRKFGPRLFRVSGFRNDTSYSWKSPSNDPKHKETFLRFQRGETGIGLIDASQRELYQTGYTSNRARQNVASFLSKHLGLDWRLGAEWYESLLADYDLSSNWGNWQYVAGVGNDPRGEARVFNPVKQSFDYDPKGEYVKAWVPELRELTDPMSIFQPWRLEDSEKKERGLDGKNWVEWPLKRIDFRPDGRGPRRGGGGGGHFGGSSKPKGERGGGMGRGQGRGGAWSGRGGGREGRRQGAMDKFNDMEG